MALTFSNAAPSRWRFPVLALLIVLIVVAPVLLLRAASQKTLAAALLVNHTRQVEAHTFELAYDVRDVEAAALAIASGVDTPKLRARIAETRTRLMPALDELQLLTRDNPAQQVRIGQLRSNIGLRLGEAAKIIDGGQRDHDTLDSLVTRFPIRDLTAQMVAEERSLLDGRASDARASQRQAEALRWISMLAQLVLLIAVTYFWVRQIARRFEAERDAKAASNRAGVVLDTVREPIVLADRHLRVVMHNAAFGELFGVKASDDVQGKPLAEIGDGAWGDEETQRRLSDVLARNRELWDFQRVQRTADGIDRTMLINARQMSLPDSDGVVALITASDISAQQASEQQIRELNRQLEGKVDQVSDVNRELEAFSYSVSHDLRAPLRHIAGFTDKLGRQLGDAADDKSRHYINVIGTSAKRMSQLIDDLLVYSRLGRSALRLQVVDTQSMVEETRAMLDSNLHIDLPDHELRWNIGPMPVLVADENMLRQVWLNLLGNAAKYSSLAEPAMIDVRHDYDDDGSHHFQVRDNGAGFDMAYAGKLFGVFQRLHSANEFPGTGIGLASVKRVVTRHGGRIWAESAIGDGATFHVVLPATLEPPAKATRTP